MPRIEPTADQLLAAFGRLRRHGWPTTLEDALTDPLRAALLRGDAVRHALRRSPSPRSGTPPTTKHRHHAGIDRKRAAAGEREDD